MEFKVGDRVSSTTKQFENCKIVSILHYSNRIMVELEPGWATMVTPEEIHLHLPTVEILDAI
jgi:hypothetical protein